MKVNDAVHDAGSDPIDPAKNCLNYAVRDRGSDKMELANEWLWLLSDIAKCGARSQDPVQVEFALQELSRLLIERTGTEEILFEPSEAQRMISLEKLLENLEFVDPLSRELPDAS